MNPAPNSHNSAPHIVAGIVSAVRTMAERFHEKFGSPAQLLERRDLYDDLRKSALRWLADMEACVRRMLLLRACLFNPPQTSFTQRETPLHPKNIGAESRPAYFPTPWKGEGDPQTLYGPSTDSSQWRVCFALPVPTEAGWVGAAPYADAACSNKRDRKDGPARPAKPVPAFYWADDPRPIAERYEALLRVLADPDHYAERLAARLHYWRGRAESKAALVRSLYKVEAIADEAGIGEETWALFAEAGAMAKVLSPVFMHAAPVEPWRPSG